MTLPTIEHERGLARRLLDLVSSRARREHEIEARHANEISAEQQQYQQVFQLLNETYEGEYNANAQSHGATREAIEQRWQDEAAGVQEQYDLTLQQIDEQSQADVEAAQKERDEAGWLLSSLLDGDTTDSPLARLQALQTGMAATRSEMDSALTTLDGWYRTTSHFLQKCRVLGEAPPPGPSTLPADMLGLHQTCMESMRQADPIQKRVLRRILPRLFGGVWPLLLFVLCGGLIGGSIWLLLPPTLIGLRLDPAAKDWMWISLGAGSAIGLVLLFLMHLYAGQLVIPDFERLVQLAADADAAYQKWLIAAQRECDLQEAELQKSHEAREKKREAAVVHSDARLQARLKDAESRRLAALKDAESTFPARLAEIKSTSSRELQELDARVAATQRVLLSRRDGDFKNLQAEFDQRVTQSRLQYQQSWTELVKDWQTRLREIGVSADEMNEVLRRNCPKWSTVLGGWLESRIPPQEASLSPTDGILSVGRIVMDLTAIPSGVSPDARLATERSRFDVPLLLSLADRPSLVVHSDANSRSEATQLLQTAMLRYLTTLPPGKVRFTIFDPVGLGVNFASFMHLTDIDEQMVTSRIWSEPAHIEKRLAELTEHMETVLQTYLRNEYATLDDYNRDAGEVAEPYRILVVANFPANFTEIALRRLASIVEGGVKCGVFVLISIGDTSELPRSFSLAEIERQATVLKPAASMKPIASVDVLKDLVTSHPGETTTSVETKSPMPAAADGPQHSAFRLVDPVLSNWPLILDAPPATDDFGQIVRRAGHLAKSVRRVEVPFERVMPPADAFWTSSSRAGLDIPIGRAGATKLQHLRLGKGTSQHVLVAGKTGSGKSSLFHALITNAALHYSPDEVEFYLIDFKKGVEFKTYATNRLPHARVIAIESDREFGVSVLQRLDNVLKDRGEMFRRVGVQDLAGYRDACPDQVLPRVMLMIDEFQEFFVEDDALSQSAALLFDRLIRQGRAFGVHVLLGSQTLAGAYSLARSTLGQIAVRIALQCSDADAHLILSEDNTAARLLSRPGEAIYNDANGLVEGNHHFQVVWLDDSKRETYLEWMQQWATEYQARKGAGGESMWPEAAVFEGNIAADPVLNEDFVSATRQIVHPEPIEAFHGVRSCWLGEAVALTGPTQLQFGPRDGGPVLLIGRDEEAALGVLTTSIMALAGQKTDSIRILVLDGSLPDSLPAKTWQALGSLIPNLKIVGPRDATAALQEIVETMQAGSDDTLAATFVVAFDIARFRDLKKAEDDFGGFGGFDKQKTVNPSALFAEIVKEGPSASVFPFVWCDGYQTAQRWLGRELLNRFELRVLFAMNANDSSNLIDSPAAGRLGPNRALLYRGDLGTLDKFRPYRAPSPDWIDDLRRNLLATTVETAEVPDEEPVNGHIETPSAPDVIESPPTDIEDTWTDIGELNVN